MGKKPKPKSPIELPHRYHCGLCLQKPPPVPVSGPATNLCESHILADHMGEWAKARSASKQFRNANAPNRGSQDLPKIRLLCDRCEGEIERKYEKSFMTEVWDPFCVKLEAAGGELPDDVPLPTAPWMNVHTLSVAWRALHVHKDENRRRYELSGLAKDADDEWRPALEVGGLPTGPRSYFWVIQSKKMDQLLRKKGHEDNREFILFRTYLGNSDGLMAVRPLRIEHRRIKIGSQIVGFNQTIPILKHVETSRGYYMSIVKGFGFCFLGVHTKDRAVARDVDLDEETAELLVYALQESRSEIGDKLRGNARAKDAAAHKEHEANPTLTMKAKAKDEAARAKRKKPQG